MWPMRGGLSANSMSVRSNGAFTVQVQLVFSIPLVGLEFHDLEFHEFHDSFGWAGIS